MHTYTCTYLYLHTHTYMHTYTHTYICTHTHTHTYIGTLVKMTHWRFYERIITLDRGNNVRDACLLQEGCWLAESLYWDGDLKVKMIVLTRFVFVPFLPTDSCVGRLGPGPIKLSLPPPESRPCDPLDRVLVSRLQPQQGGWVSAPTEAPLFVPDVAPRCVATSGPAPKPPKRREATRREWWRNTRQKCGGSLEKSYWY